MLTHDELSQAYLAWYVNWNFHPLVVLYLSFLRDRMECPQTTERCMTAWMSSSDRTNCLCLYAVSSPRFGAVCSRNTVFDQPLLLLCWVHIGFSCSTEMVPAVSCHFLQQLRVVPPSYNNLTLYYVSTLLQPALHTIS